jgi:hypothetical protein
VIYSVLISAYILTHLDCTRCSTTYRGYLRHPHCGSRGLWSASGNPCQEDGKDRDRARGQVRSSVWTEGDSKLGLCIFHDSDYFVDDGHDNHYHNDIDGDSDDVDDSRSTTTMLAG